MDTPHSLSHLDEHGHARMVDVSHKSSSLRIAKASGEVTMPKAVIEHLQQHGHHTRKGSIIDTAILAGIMAAKQTSTLIPLCHPLPLSSIDIAIDPVSKGFRIHCEVRTAGPTGVEMEALTGVSVAALTIYDMCKALSHDIVIGPVQLESKTGGKSDFSR